MQRNYAAELFRGIVPRNNSAELELFRGIFQPILKVAITSANFRRDGWWLGFPRKYSAELCRRIMPRNYAAELCRGIDFDGIP